MCIFVVVLVSGVAREDSGRRDHNSDLLAHTHAVGVQLDVTLYSGFTVWRG